MNLRFEFGTLRSVVKHTLSTAMDSVKEVPEIQHSAHITTHSSNSNASGITHNANKTQGAVNVTPILLAAASGKLNVFRELLWRHADCRYGELYISYTNILHKYHAIRSLRKIYSFCISP